MQLNKLKSPTISPDSSSPTDRKEKRSKTKKLTRSSSVVIDLSDGVKEKKRDSASRKRVGIFYFYKLNEILVWHLIKDYIIYFKVRPEDDDILMEKKKKSDERCKLYFHANF